MILYALNIFNVKLHKNYKNKYRYTYGGVRHIVSYSIQLCFNGVGKKCAWSRMIVWNIVLTLDVWGIYTFCRNIINIWGTFYKLYKNISYKKKQISLTCNFFQQCEISIENHIESIIPRSTTSTYDPSSWCAKHLTNQEMCCITPTLFALHV
mgnify:CR=1 FL=1